MTRTNTPAETANDYVRLIRNPLKRGYAKRYLASRLDGLTTEEPYWGLSMMAAQAVRLEIDAILNRPAATPGAA